MSAQIERPVPREPFVVRGSKLLIVLLWIAPLLVLVAAVMMSLVSLPIDLRRSSAMQVALHGTGLISLYVLAVVIVYFNCSRVVLWAEFDEQLRFRRIFGERRVPWEEVGRCEMTHNDPNTSFCEATVRLMLVDGTRLMLWTTNALGEAAYAWVNGRRWARGWPGTPLGIGKSAALFLTGALAALAGVAAVVALIQELLDPRVGAVPMDRGLASLPYLGKFLILLVLLGPPLLLIGAYHLLRRPIYYRGGVFISGLLPPERPWLRFKNLLFGAPASWITRRVLADSVEETIRETNVRVAQVVERRRQGSDDTQLLAEFPELCLADLEFVGRTAQE